MKVGDVAFTAYAVADLARARAFYQGVLGLGPLETPVRPMALLRDPDGGKICIHRRKSPPA